MKSATPKVLHPVAGRSLVGHAIAACAAVQPTRICVVVRDTSDEVAEHARACEPRVVLAQQDSIKGTGRAVECGLAVLDALAMSDAASSTTPDDATALDAPMSGPVIVTSGDSPLADGDVLAALLRAHGEGAGAVTMLTTHVADPTGYGRIVRDRITGEVTRIVEHRDCTPEQLAIDEINASVYVFDAAWLRRALAQIGTANAQGEKYLTDAIAIVRAEGGVVRAYVSPDPWVAEGVNDREQLASLGAEFNRRLVRAAMLDGVTVQDPATTWLDVEVSLARDVTLLPGTQLKGSTRVATGAVVGPDTTLTDTVVGESARVERTVAHGAVIDAGATVGPFAYLRPGTHLGADGKIGAFVETKNAEIGQSAKVPHLSYVGDAEIGEGSNIGASTIFVNYDGVTKRRTTVGAHVRIGSDNTLVAPLTIGDGAYTGAGSIIRHDVPPGALGLNSAPQRNVEGWVERRRPGTASAEAARKALGPGDTLPAAGDGTGDTQPGR